MRAESAEAASVTEGPRDAADRSHERRRRHLSTGLRQLLTASKKVKGKGNPHSIAELGFRI